MPTNRWNTIIKQVEGSSLRIDFSDSPSRPFQIIVPNGQCYAFKSQTLARKFVLEYEKNNSQS